MEFFHPALSPFTIALMVMGLIALLEVVGLLFGVAFSGILDNMLPDFGGDFDLDGEIDMADANGADALGGSPLTHFLSWLCVGKVPVLILLAAFLAGFGLSGVILQNVVHGAFGFYLPGAAAVAVALMAALPATRFIGLAIARILPKEETDAVSTTSFIGAVAVVFRGEAKRGQPAEARLKDLKGTTQYVLVEPDTDDTTFAQGDEVVLVEISGAIYRAIANHNPALARAHSEEGVG